MYLLLKDRKNKQHMKQAALWSNQLLQEQIYYIYIYIYKYTLYIYILCTSYIFMYIYIQHKILPPGVRYFILFVYK